MKKTKAQLEQENAEMRWALEWINKLSDHHETGEKLDGRFDVCAHFLAGAVRSTVKGTLERVGPK